MDVVRYRQRGYGIFNRRNYRIARNYYRAGRALWNTYRNRQYQRNRPTRKLNYKKRRTKAKPSSVGSSGRSYKIFNDKRKRTRKRPLKVRVKKLENKLAATWATHVYKFIDAGIIESEDGKCKYSVVNGIYTTDYTNAINTLEYYDPANPTSQRTVNGATGDYDKSFRIDNIWISAYFKNNYRYQARLRVYVLEPKLDTNVEPSQTIADGLFEQGVSIVKQESTALFPSDSERFKATWKIVKTYSTVLSPGEDFTVTHTCMGFNYETEVGNGMPIYSTKYKTCAILARLEGGLAHPAGVGASGPMAADLDTLIKKKIVVKYPGGADMHTISLTDNTSTDMTSVRQVPNRFMPAQFDETREFNGLKVVTV